MKDFSSHGSHSFLEYAKAATDCLTARSFRLYQERFPKQVNESAVKAFEKVFAVNFYNGMVVFQVRPGACVPSEIVRNRERKGAQDFRRKGTRSARIDWPNVLKPQQVTVKGS